MTDQEIINKYDQDILTELVEAASWVIQDHLECAVEWSDYADRLQRAVEAVQDRHGIR